MAGSCSEAAAAPRRIDNDEFSAIKAAGYTDQQLVDIRVKLTSSIAAVFTAIALGTAAGHTHELEEVKTVFEHAIPNIAGKSLKAQVVTYPPGGKSLSHRHAGSAFIYAHVPSGTIRSQVDDEPAKVYRVGEGFYEVPGSHHRVSENASDREPASLLAVFVVDSNDNPLTISDQK